VDENEGSRTPYMKLCPIMDNDLPVSSSGTLSYPPSSAACHPNPSLDSQRSKPPENASVKTLDDPPGTAPGILPSGM